MQFLVKNPISEPMSEAIIRWMRALDGSSETLVDAETRQIHINSRLSVPQIIEVLRNAGCEASFSVQSEIGHKQGGSTCCGGCS
ncbi:hypothetical protein GCM10010960_00420 [Arenimonas maotaiensis]|uniref:Copper chaperone n=1 Tax=Arenimonas maotaiensis TaxID=1446479 RepID=A0A917CAN7_9GAMM|nr:hypothetical protein [Arenimonas maotaiensis]GGF82267.1 hypothetical protein GCM10010960_00420 [Arenimonas maotaiensis]